MRCLMCLGYDLCARWCPSQRKPALTATRVMPAVETDERPAEMPVAVRSARPGAPVWSVVCVALGAVLMGLALVAYGVVTHVAEGGVTWS